jgi:hypothetical protein
MSNVPVLTYSTLVNRQAPPAQLHGRLLNSQHRATRPNQTRIGFFSARHVGLDLMACRIEAVQMLVTH